MSHYDLCIIGGGVNGTAIARDAAGRGLSVLLLEAEDLAGATSSASTKLIHGGLRYLEYYEFKLVHEALAERKVMLNAAPHIIHPLIFTLPHDRHLRPAWMIRAGLFLYDHLATRAGLPGSRGINLKRHAYGRPLKESYKRGFTYSDCWVDDARLVALYALDAKERSATILTRTPCESVEPGRNEWIISYAGHTVTASMLVNAAGPWVRQVLDHNKLVTTATPNVRLVKGSHIVIPRLFDGEHAYILQQPDRRIVFAIPYEKNFTLIGTTDENFTGDPRHVHISDNEIQYLCDAVNRSFRIQVKSANVIWSYSGVRPLVDDGQNNASSVTRDYRLDIEDFKSCPVLSVFGGKITTSRHLAEEAVNKLLQHTMREGKSWTKVAYLPGGDLPGNNFNAFVTEKARLYPWLPEHVVQRYARAYGTRMDRVIGNATHIGDLGQHYGANLYEAEARYLIREEFAKTPEDVLWRRTKIGLHGGQEVRDALEQAWKGLAA